MISHDEVVAPASPDDVAATQSPSGAEHALVVTDEKVATLSAVDGGRRLTEARRQGLAARARGSETVVQPIR